MGSLAESLMGFAYSAAVRAMQPLLRRKLRKRGQREAGYLYRVEERFGHYADDLPHQGPWLWIHAVSLGETRAAAILLQSLRALLPDLRLLLTHSTATGRDEGRKLLQPGDVQLWLPWDTPEAVERFLSRFQPVLGVLMETEVWPNLVKGCQRHAIPLLLINARLNEKSWRQAQRLQGLSRPSYRGLSAVYAQSAEDAQRLKDLGAPVQGIYGNLKFDVPRHPSGWQTGRQCRAALGTRPVVMFASSREGEEAEWLQHWLDWAARRAPRSDRALWVMVPRHPQRFDEVAGLLAQQSLKVVRRSALGNPADWMNASEVLQNADVLLGDSLGEMPLYYGMSDMALLGGSFLPLGGQNLIEAAACDCPVIMGPHTFNFDEVAQWAEREGAAKRVPDMSGAWVQVQRWVEQPDEHQQAVLGCSRLLEKGRGAAQLYAEAVAQGFRVATAR